VSLAARLQEQRDMRDKAAQDQSKQIGEDGGTLRVLNFSGGGFDAVMQLGVTHALLVNQGRAPDIVVGVSAGAIHAAALAEILRAGQLPDGKIDLERYEAVLSERVRKFRKFSDACHNAPESIVDTVVPDAYQIDSFEPLASMRLPRLSAAERDERDNWISRKTGLVRLYNDVLSLDLPFGALTRIIRRGLGTWAAGSMINPFKRWVLRMVEVMRLWLVVGSELRRLAPVLPILVRPLMGRSGKVHPSTAGSIIFQFRPVVGLWRLIRALWSFSFVLNLWLVLSVVAVTTPFLLVLLGGVIVHEQSLAHEYLYVFLLLYLLPIVLPLTPFALAYDKTGFGTAFKDLSKGMFAFFYYLLKWLVVLVLLFVATLLVLGAAYWVVALIVRALIAVGIVTGDSPQRPVEFFSAWDVFILFVVITVFLIVVRPLVWAVSAWISYRRSKKKKQQGFGRWYAQRFFDSYGIGSALAENYNLKRLIVELFDPGYYGSTPIEPVLAASLKDEEVEGFTPAMQPSRKALASYIEKRSGRDRPIRVAVTTADIGTGQLYVLPKDNSVVDSLLAATAATPIFPAVNIDGKVLIDAVHVGNDPTKALVELFIRAGVADVASVHIYPVEPLPISREELGKYAPVEGQPFVNLLDIVMRALQLQRFRDATVDRTMTQVVSDTLPAGAGTIQIRDNGKPRKFFRAKIAPIELDFSPALNSKILFGDKEERRTAIDNTIAAGCRAALEVMHAEVIGGMKAKTAANKARFVECEAVMAKVAERRKIDVAKTPLPGSDIGAPGLREICKHCRICDEHGKQIHDKAVRSLLVRQVAQPTRKSTDTEQTPLEPVPDWPHELEEELPSEDTPVIATDNQHQPGDKAKDPDAELPAVACLFSGGVFRGVFQLGVLNALSLLETRPRIVAGASIGSITAAMVAAALSKPDPDERNLLVARMASVYIGVDRIILTDRFSDFIRNWTIRASETKFSLRQMDKVFRKYDEGRAKVFQRNVREVLAGLERLFYINPYQVNRIVRALRNRTGGEAAEQLKDNVQQWLNRMDVGEEVLGAEPLQMLIEEFVIPDKYSDNPESAPFECIDDNTMFLATATNLTDGKFELLPRENEDTTLIEGLLASSAFPAVFRPRRSWDLHPGTNEINQFIDGGVMDNLPLVSALDQMRKLANNAELPLRSTHGPHLMLAASLEIDSEREDEIDPETIAEFWPALMSRAGELKYNTKLNNFERVTANLQKIHYCSDAMRTPMRVKVLAVKPRWLCNTFAFHPMLGFRRITQVRSIAHGCAATLIAMGGEADNVGAWQLNDKAVPSVGSFKAALGRLEKPDRKAIAKGQCWLQGVKCPFSKPEVKRFGGSAIDRNTRDWLSKIHERCWERGTHVRQ
jgi:predicted acylesterase/phospholipase RssA